MSEALDKRIAELVRIAEGSKIAELVRIAERERICHSAMVVVDDLGCCLRQTEIWRLSSAFSGPCLGIGGPVKVRDIQDLSAREDPFPPPIAGD